MEAERSTKSAAAATHNMKRKPLPIAGSGFFITAGGGIKALEEFVKECGLPTKMSQLRSNVEITPEVLRKVADTCNIIKTNPRELDREEIYQILMECM